MTDTSIYVANQQADVSDMQSWLGTDLDAIQLVGGYASWFDWLNSPSWIAGQLSKFQGDIKWSIGLMPWGASLAEAGKGSYDDKYVQLAKSMVASAGGDDPIYIRAGWEFNGNGWFPWSANGKEADYASAYRHFVDAFRSVSDKFVFEWTPNAGNMGMNPEAAYPGDDYVDVIGIDFYYNKAWDPADPTTAWNWFVNEPYGLQWQQDFANAHGKQTAVGEWGVNSDTAGPFIEMAAQWFQDHDMLYQNYWNSNADFAGKLSSGQYSNTGAAFKAIFGGSLESYVNSMTAPVNRTGGGGVDVMVGHGGNDTLSGGDGNDWLHGYAGKDILKGGNGNDLLDGGTGADTLYGGKGDDTFLVDDIGDRIIEYAGEGIDTVKASIDFSLAGLQVENLTLTGSAISATGNAFDNVLVGNDADNILDGGAGADTMTGGKGNDTYIVDHVGDKVVELAGEGTDTVKASIDFTLDGLEAENLTLTGAAKSATGNVYDNVLTGNAYDNVIFGGEGKDIIDGNDGNDLIDGGDGNDTIYGGKGNDTITGGAGADTMRGGVGDDTYYVDNIRDNVRELPGEGSDTIISTVSYSLDGRFCENLTLAGAENVNATGNGYNNVIIGNEGNNVIDGASGADRMFGGLGNDTYYVDNVGDNVRELENEGNDTIISSVTYTLVGRYCENIYLTGSEKLNATGNGSANVVVGNSGDNIIDGQGIRDGNGGIDVMTGGGGNDTFVFNRAGPAMITDFGIGDSLWFNESLGSASSAKLTQAADGVYVHLNTETEIFLQGLTADHLIMDAHGYHFA